MEVLQPTQRVRLKVATFGKAPKGHGDRVYKITDRCAKKVTPDAAIE